MTFAYLVRDWLIRGVLGGINQSGARFVKDIMNSENCYVIYLLLIASQWKQKNITLMYSQLKVQYIQSFLYCSPFSYRSSKFAIAKVVALNLFASIFV